MTKKKSVPVSIDDDHPNQNDLKPSISTVSNNNNNSNNNNRNIRGSYDNAAFTEDKTPKF